MAAKNQHVIVAPKGSWSVRSSGAARSTRVFATHEEALAFARELAKRDGGELYVHGRDGSVREKTTFARDPASLKSA